MTMKDAEIKQKALDTLFIMNTAIRNLRLYPATSATIINSIEKLYESLQGMFDQEKTICFAEAEKSLLVCGEPLSQKDLEKPQVAGLMEILLNYCIKSINFDYGFDRDELLAFMEILAKKTENIDSASGLAQIMAEKKLTRIRINEKVYVVQDKNKQILSNLAVDDEKIIQFLLSGNPELAADIQKLEEMANNPEWIKQIFQSGISRIMEQAGTLSDLQISENLVQVITLLEKIAGNFSPEDQDRISQDVAKSIAVADIDITDQTIVRKMEHLFGGKLMQNILNTLAEEKSPEQSVDDAGTSTEILGRESTEQLKERIVLLLQNDERAFLDHKLMADLPAIFVSLAAKNEQAVTETIISRLISNLFKENAEIRDQAATALANIIERLPSRQKMELLEKILDKLVDWIRFESLATLGHRKICNILRNHVRDLILLRRYGKTIPILDVFNYISVGMLEKNDTIHELSTEFIRNLATNELLDVLFEAFNSDDQEIRIKAGQVLVRLGDIPQNHLLDILRDHKDSNERVLIIQLISELGPMAMPVVRDRINKKESWYYLRNLAYMLGKIGNEESAAALMPLLFHEHNRVRHEALKSIHHTGGNEGGPLLTAVLSQVDEQFKIAIVETLGHMKYAGAVRDLVNMLKNRPLVASPLRVSLEEKICLALGSIGLQEAIPALSEVSGFKSFLRMKSYPDKVKNAASRALASIKNKQAEAADRSKQK
jgi:HEAT repeat protein